MINLPLSFRSEAEVLAAYRAAGGRIGDTDTVFIVKCTGTPPTFFDAWTYRPGDQVPNLYKGPLDMREVVAVQAPSQQNGYTRLGAIEREFKDYEFVGAHVAEWYCCPENMTAFLEVCPSGYLVFLEKYRNADRDLVVVDLRVRAGRVCVGGLYADNKFGGGGRFAVRRKLSA